MFLGDSQKRIISLLEMYGVLREYQLEAMIKAEFEKQNFKESMKRLVYYGLIKCDGGLIILQGKENAGKSPFLLQAVDVMLSFNINEIETHKPAVEPIILTFFKPKGGGLNRYDIYYCPQMREQVLTAELEAVGRKHRTAIIVLEDISQRKDIFVKCNHYFAAPDKVGYRFYVPVK